MAGSRRWDTKEADTTERLHFLSGGSDGRESDCNVGDPGSIPGSGRSPGEVNGYPLHELRKAWQAAVHGVAKS